MKKLLVIFMAAVMCLMSCTKDSSVVKKLYNDSTTIENVTYAINITNIGEDYFWENTNKTEEVTLKYKFNYERKSDLLKDFAELAEGVSKFDNSLVPAFTQTFRFTNDEEHEVVVYREVSGGNVLVRFVVGPKTFSLPYSFIVGANNALQPKE
jgi:hypothetical protein